MTDRPVDLDRHLDQYQEIQNLRNVVLNDMASDNPALAARVMDLFAQFVDQVPGELIEALTENGLLIQEDMVLAAQRFLNLCRTAGML